MLRDYNVFCEQSKILGSLGPHHGNIICHLTPNSLNSLKIERWEEEVPKFAPNFQTFNIWRANELSIESFLKFEDNHATYLNLNLQLHQSV